MPDTPMLPQVTALLPKLAQLEADLLAGDPLMKGHLKEIHKTLIQYEEISHLLSEEQLATILDAQQRQVGILLAEETKSKKSGGAASKLPKVGGTVAGSL